MASILLSSAGSALGGAVAGPLGAFFGARIGQMAGGMLDQRVFGAKKLPRAEGGRLADLGVQTSTYGKMIPLVYGTVRIAGNVIWSRPIKETVTTSTSSAGGGGKGGGKMTQTQTSYSYSITLAIAICEGPIDAVLRIWADAKPLNAADYTIRIYKGDEEQLPDSLMQSHEGADATPAYRGLAYIVLEDFPLADYGNRIPNFTFEVQKKVQYPDYNGEVVENTVTAMTLIPGAGEFVYDTQAEYKIPGISVGGDWLQQGNRQIINMHTPEGKANALVALDQLAATCPNVNWVSVVVSWFGDDLDCAACEIKPGVEYQDGATTAPGVWAVAGYTRATARQITLVGDSPQYGGTPDDAGIIRLLDELRGRGYNIMFYPMLFMDVSGKPWRGMLTGGAGDIPDFFTKASGYNAFIMHYASLVAGKVEAFVIGSELIGLTKVTDTPGNYPAVNELISLAGSVKAELGSSVKVTYAADWSEYHHTDGGWYNMDPLWACADIDVIGIDAYFPLTDSVSTTYDIDAIRAGWTSGEGYDWYYSDPERSVQAPLSAAYAWKNINWFWNNAHTNPDSTPTAWVPGSKKIWFTEYGFPSVDCATNQPNVFYDPTSSASALPYYSKGRVDFSAQRAAVAATEHEWAGSAMVGRKFLWTWDARPYPYWPDLNAVWADGSAWKTGHWVQGKFGISSLASIVAHLCARAGFAAEDYVVSAIAEPVEGFALTSQLTVRDSLEQLQHAYFFDCVESDNQLKFVPRRKDAVLSIDASELAVTESDPTRHALRIIRAQEAEMPGRVNVLYMNRLYNYQTAAQYAQRETHLSNDIVTTELPLVLSDQKAKTIAEIMLYTAWVERTSYQLALPVRYAALEPSDIIEITENDNVMRMRITSAYHASTGVIKLEAVADDSASYDFYHEPGRSGIVPPAYQAVGETRLELLDLPAFPGDGTESAVLRAGACGVDASWKGAVLFRAEDESAEYARITGLASAATLGSAVTGLAAGPACVFDEVNTVTVVSLGESELQSVSSLAVLNGANAALLGEEIIQFAEAVLLSPGTYELRTLLRGRLGSEHAIGTHVAGERFILLDQSIGHVEMAGTLFHLSRFYKAVSVGATLPSAQEQAFAYHAVALKPYSPVHISGSRSAGDLHITWVRRTRIGGEWMDGAEVPLAESAELYDAEILDGADVVRSFTNLSSPSVTYSAAQQTADFGAPQTSVSLRIYQLSARVGRGFAVEVTL